MDGTGCFYMIEHFLTGGRVMPVKVYLDELEYSQATVKRMFKRTFERTFERTIVLPRRLTDSNRERASKVLKRCTTRRPDSVPVRLLGSPRLCLPLLVALLPLAALAAQPLLAPMIDIPAGVFLMGSDAGPDDERPAHEVVLLAYAIDRLPVTNAGFAAFLNAAGPRNARGERLYDEEDSDARIHFTNGLWRAEAGFEAHPAVEVSFRGATEYCAWAGKRLPTEAEWEKAARGADGRRYPWGNQRPDATRARYGAAFNATVPVGSHRAGASAYGVLDMAGNVWQWTSSLYRPYPWRAHDGREDARTDTRKDTRTDARKETRDSRAAGIRVTRGGAHDWPAEALTATHRGRGLSRSPAAGHHNIGFRCAR